jgi:hypothetical protein
MNRSAGLAPIMALLLSGCAAWSTPTPAHQPYFPSDPKDSKTFQSLAKRQEQLALKCGESNTCDHVYFTRALIGLYESRDVAEGYFKKVIAIAPKSQLAASSKAWIQLIRERAAPREHSWGESVLAAPAIADANLSLAQTTDRLVRDLLDRELMIQQLRGVKESDVQAVETLSRELTDRERTIDALTSKKEEPVLAPEPTAIHNLKKQLVERDKKIQELSRKLEALKRIDQEMREKVRPIRPPSGGNLKPAPDGTP